MKRVWFAVLVGALVTSTAGASLAGGEELLGAGATFPYPLYSKMFDVYHKEFGVKVNYQAIGSGGGIRQLVSRTVDFGGTDAFIGDENLEDLENPILHVPICLGAVVITYNMPGNPTIRFTRDIVADIFLGKLTRWNDPRLVAANPNLELPDMTIVVVHRSDGSGTSFIFSDYLSKTSEDWRKSVGTGKALNWPAGLGAKGNPGVAGLVEQLPGAVGYVELAYALQNDMPVGAIQNRAGNYITPSIEAVSLASETDIPAHTRVSITDTDTQLGYPISGFTWLILYQNQEYSGRKHGKALALVEMMWWMIHDGQEFAEPLHYAPLPVETVRQSEKILASVMYGGHSLIDLPEEKMHGETE